MSRGPAFISGFWGRNDSANSRLQHKIVHDILTQRKYERFQSLTYCFGRQNADFLRSIGIEPIVLSEHGLPRWGDGPGEMLPQSADNDPPLEPVAADQYNLIRTAHRAEWDRHRNRLIDGRSHWRCKLEILRTALETFQSVLWTDFEVHLLRPIPPEFWHRMGQRRAVQAPLICRRKSGLRKRENRRFLPDGCFIYARDIRLVDRLIEIHSTRCPTQTDEVALSMLIDELNGGWRGPASYYDGGFSPYCFVARNGLRKPRPEDALFCIGMRPAIEDQIRRGNLERVDTVASPARKGVKFAPYYKPPKWKFFDELTGTIKK